MNYLYLHPKMKRILAITSLVLLIAITGFLAYVKYVKKTITTEAFGLIPTNAIYILEATDPVSNWNSFSSSEFWTYLGNHQYLTELNDDAKYLDSLVESNSFLLKHIGKRNVFMSAHLTSASDYDFLFLVDLKDAAKFNLTTTLIGEIIDKDDFKAKEEDYFGYTILDILDLKEQDHLYLSQVDNFLVLSYSRNLIKQCIDEKQNPSFSVDKKFLNAKSKTSKNGLARIYFQYDYLDEYLGLYYKGNESLTKSLSQSFSFTGLDMYLTEDELKLKGHTTISDSIINYAQLLQKYGNSDFNFDKVLSSRTAYAQVICLNDFTSFYDEVLELRQNSSNDVASYNKLKNKVEKVLGLSLKDDFLSWIGNEVVVAQNLPSKIHNNEDDMVVAIKASDLIVAEEKLLHIQKMIKRRTPAKFKKLEYKNHPIHYLEINNLFEVFFGKAFKDLTKPYYTTVEDYIIFSNSPKTLVSTLEDYENGYTLSNLESFKNIKNNTSGKSTLFTYVNGELTYEVFKKSISPKKRSNYHKNRKYITYFKNIGITYTSNENGFDNTIYSNFSTQNIITINPSGNVDSLYKLYYTDYSADLDNLSESEIFVLSNLNDNKFIKYYKGSSVIQFKCNTKNGMLHGKAFEYFVNGNLKAEGRYRKGKKTGIWKYYSVDGEMNKKTWKGL
jgi:hypothetical protein